MLSKGGVSAQDKDPQHAFPPGWMAPQSSPTLEQPPGGGPATWQVLLIQLKPGQQSGPGPPQPPPFDVHGGGPPPVQQTLAPGTLAEQSPST